MLIAGPCCTGKSHIAQALGHAAVRADYEREEAIAGGAFTGRRSKRGRALVAEFKARIKAIEGERDEARTVLRERTAERDRALEASRGWEARALEVEHECRALRARVPDPEAEECASQATRALFKRSVNDARRSGLAEGLRVAGDVFVRLFLSRGRDVRHRAVLRPLLDALRAGDAEGVAKVVPSSAAPVQGGTPGHGLLPPPAGFER